MAHVDVCSSPFVTDLCYKDPMTPSRLVWAFNHSAPLLLNSKKRFLGVTLSTILNRQRFISK